MRKIIIILAILLSSCGAKKKQTERIKEVKAFEVERVQQKKVSIDSAATISITSTNETIEVEADSTGVVTKETKGNKIIFTGAKKVTIKTEEKKEDTQIDVKKEIKERDKIKVEDKSETKKRTSDVKITGRSGYLWWLLLIIPLYLIYRNRDKILPFFKF
jgi:hypothetical protein